MAALLLLRLGAVPLLGPDEPRYARVAVEMHRSGDLVTPTLQGQPWLEKPPLYYWLAGGAFALLGETEAAARLPSVVAGLLFVGVTALVGARLYGSAAGLHAGFVARHLASCPSPTAAPRPWTCCWPPPSPPPSGLIGLRLLGIAGRFAVPAAGVAMGLAILAKGPLGLLLPALVVAGYVVATAGLAAAAAARSPPPACCSSCSSPRPGTSSSSARRARRFVDVFLLDHNVQRFTSTIHRHPGPWHYYVGLVLLGLFPWSGLLVPAIARLRPRRLADRPLRLRSGSLLPFLFFSAAGSKLPGYILPCLPPLALLMGRAARDLDERRCAGRSPRRGARRPSRWRSRGRRAVRPAGLGEPGWTATLPLAAWTLLAVGRRRRAHRTRPGGGAAPAARRRRAGLLLLLALAAPPILARRESGRDLFLPARRPRGPGLGRLAHGVDGRLLLQRREGAGGGAASATWSRRRRAGPVLVICGPARAAAARRARPALATRVLAEGPRGSALLRVGPRP